MQWGNHFSQRKYIKPLGIRTINQSCAEQHEMKKDHVRFNQKMNMIFQPNWNEKYKPYTDKLRNDSAVIGAYLGKYARTAKN